MIPSYFFQSMSTKFHVRTVCWLELLQRCIRQFVLGDVCFFYCRSKKYGLDEGQYRRKKVNAYEDCWISPWGTRLLFSVCNGGVSWTKLFHFRGKKKRSWRLFKNIYEILEKMKSVFGNVLIGKKALAVPLLSQKTDIFLKIKISRCLEGSLIKNGKNI